MRGTTSPSTVRRRGRAEHVTIPLKERRRGRDPDATLRLVRCVKHWLEWNHYHSSNAGTVLYERTDCRPAKTFARNDQAVGANPTCSSRNREAVPLAKKQGRSASLNYLPVDWISPHPPFSATRAARLLRQWVAPVRGGGAAACLEAPCGTGLALVRGCRALCSRHPRRPVSPPLPFVLAQPRKWWISSAWKHVF